MNNQQNAEQPEKQGAGTEQEKEVNIEPSESESRKTGDPGRTPGKAEGEDDESATDEKNG